VLERVASPVSNVQMGVTPSGGVSGMGAGTCFRSGWSMAGRGDLCHSKSDSGLLTCDHADEAATRESVAANACVANVRFFNMTDRAYLVIKMATVMVSPAAAVQAVAKLPTVAAVVLDLTTFFIIPPLPAAPLASAETWLDTGDRPLM